MKIRDKVTDEVYEAFSIESWNGKIQYCKVGTNGPLRYADQVEILEEDKPKDLDNFDWQPFRANAAKDAMCAMIAEDTKDGIYPDPEEICGMALCYADELIRQLREEEK